MSRTSGNTGRIVYILHCRSCCTYYLKVQSNHYTLFKNEFLPCFLPQHLWLPAEQGRCSVSGCQRTVTKTGLTETNKCFLQIIWKHFWNPFLGNGNSTFQILLSDWYICGNFSIGILEILNDAMLLFVKGRGYPTKIKIPEKGSHVGACCLCMVTII